MLSLDSAVLAAHEFWEVFGPGGRLHPAYFLEHKGHLVVEGMLLFIIAFLFLQTSFKPKAVKAEAPLTDKVGWVETMLSQFLSMQRYLQ